MVKIMNNWIAVTSLTKKFTDIYESVNDFIYDYNNLAIPKTISVDNAVILYYLLYGKYGNSYITNMDENQFKFKLFSTIWKYGPTWEKKLEIQGNLRELSDADILVGASAIYNHAFNPETTPTTQDRIELDYINDQNVTKYTKSQMDAYTQLWGLLATDVTEAFLANFSVLFKKFISPVTYVYESEE